MSFLEPLGARARQKEEAVTRDPMPVYRGVVPLSMRGGAPLTYTDLERMPDDGHRYELVDGALLVTPAPNIVHQRCLLRLAIALEAAAPAAYEVVIAPFDWKVSDDTLFQPDILVTRRGDVGLARLEVPPLLAVEVLSPSTRSIDLTLKRERFAQARSPWYWAVDPDVPLLIAYKLAASGRYEEETTVSGGQSYTATDPFEVTIRPAELVV